MSGFRRSSEAILDDRKLRLLDVGKCCRTGVSFLDDSFYKIMPSDLVLLGASSGVGKTELCINIALANVEDEKSVHFFALEAGPLEIERRIKWRYICQSYYGDTSRPRTHRPIAYDEWLAGDLDDVLGKYDEWADKFCAAALSRLFVYYKSDDDFDHNRLIESVVSVANKTDLIIIDHAHYFDYDDDNENRALKQIAKTTRTVALDLNKPIILVAHLRKKSLNSKELVPGLDEFHGSSDLSKIATKAATISAGKRDENGDYVTFMRTPKNRNNGSSKVFLARLTYNLKTGSYNDDYKVGWANASVFEEIDPGQCPDWLHRTRRRASSNGIVRPETKTPVANAWDERADLNN